MNAEIVDEGMKCFRATDNDLYDAARLSVRRQAAETDLDSGDGSATKQAQRKCGGEIDAIQRAPRVKLPT